MFAAGLALTPVVVESLFAISTAGALTRLSTVLPLMLLESLPY
jgi:hypothetical protein